MSVSVPNKTVLGLSAYLIFVTIHFMLVHNSRAFLLDRIAYSVVLSVVILIGAACTATISFRMEEIRFHIMIKRCTWLLLLIGLFGVIFAKNVGQIVGWRMPFPPFSEPSHFVIAAAPFALYILASREMRLFYSLLFLFLAVLIYTKSAVLLALLFLLLVMRFPFLFGGVFIVFVAVANWQALLPEYYISRVAFWNGQNLSALVYLQGWQIVYDSIMGENVLGYGFQHLGSVRFDLDASERIRSLVGRDMNILDGGFVVAKIFGEFGLFALPIVSILVFSIILSYFKILAHMNNKKALPPAVLFARCAIFGYCIELLFRGIGYFSIGGTFFLFSIAILAMHSFNMTLELRNHARS